MHTGEEECLEVAEMARRREAEQAMKQYCEPEPLPPVVKHDWTHHFRTARERAGTAELPSQQPGTAPPQASLDVSPHAQRTEAESDLLYEFVGGTQCWPPCCPVAEGRPFTVFAAVERQRIASAALALRSACRQLIGSHVA